MSKPSKTALLSPARTLIIAGSTFTQLMRMKIFYFLLIFVLGALVFNFFDLPHTAGPESTGSDKLFSLKDPLVGAMHYFAIIIAVVATALVIPKDQEDRTLYTILAKPVPRLDYLLGKLLGILALILAGLLAMDLLLNLVLHNHTQELLAQRIADATKMGWPQEAIDSERADILQQGPSWALQGAILTIFLKAGIIAAAALLISTFSSSTIFTIICTTLVYFIGQFLADGRDYYEAAMQAKDGSELTSYAARLLSVIFPDFRPFEIVNAAVAGKPFPLDVLFKLLGLTSLYMGIYTVLSWFVFSDKEI
ncbi:MAG: ABC transporter permease subunit [Verrucomicrobia bacterium]|nr:ABC transporter permease subunit [Verrucomicrobiota bacterium]MDA1006813.1 ABC transporter permease subunit [Verrucomicrobiota bacterium]